MLSIMPVPRVRFSCPDPPSWSKGYVTDRYFMRSIGVNRFHALDVTDDEGADIV